MVYKSKSLLGSDMQKLNIIYNISLRKTSADSVQALFNKSREARSSKEVSSIISVVHYSLILGQFECLLSDPNSQLLNNRIVSVLIKAVEKPPSQTSAYLLQQSLCVISQCFLVQHSSNILFKGLLSLRGGKQDILTIA